MHCQRAALTRAVLPLPCLAPSGGGLFAQSAYVSCVVTVANALHTTYNAGIPNAVGAGVGDGVNGQPIDASPLRAATGTVMFVDVVQSVAIIERDELQGIQRIRQLLAECCAEMLARHGGKLLQRMGDGLMLQFSSPREAVAFAEHAHALATRLSPDQQPLRLRIGVHRTSLYTDDVAYYGLGVNLAARIATEALPGETVVSAEVVDALKPGLDADVDDIGECRLKHVQEPMRLYRARPQRFDPEPPVVIHDDLSATPVIAVFPLISRGDDSAAAVVGELVADGLISELSRLRTFRVVSRQSTGMLDQPGQRLASRALRPAYTVSGRYMAHGDKLHLWVELRAEQSEEVLWADHYASRLEEILDPQARLLNAICGEITLAIGERALARANFSPLRTLPSCELLFGAIALTGRTSLTHFERPREMLEALIERHRTAVLPRVWLAHWYVIRRAQGLDPSGLDDGSQALFMADRALDLDPHNAHAMATQGFVAMHFRRDFDLARQRLDAAIAEDRSCAWAWLHRGALHAFMSEGDAAERNCAEALACTPFDPMRHFYLAISATAAFTNRRYGRAVDMALESRRHDRYHASTVRVLAMALALDGRVDEAQRVGKELLDLDPALTVERYVARAPSAGFEVCERCAEGLSLAGVPMR